MKTIKVIASITFVFVLMYSCSTLSPSSPIAKIVPIVVKENKVVNKQDTTIIKQGMTHDEYQAILNSTLKEYKLYNNDVTNINEIRNLRKFIDSMSKESRELFKVNASLIFIDIVNQRKSLGARELLLIEKENRLRLERENEQIKREELITTQYIGIILITGLALNLLLSLGLFIFRKNMVLKYA